MQSGCRRFCLWCVVGFHAAVDQSQHTKGQDGCHDDGDDESRIEILPLLALAGHPSVLTYLDAVNRGCVEPRATCGTAALGCAD